MKFLKKLSIRGIVVGAVVDIVATNLFVIPLIIYAISAHQLFLLSAEKMSVVLVSLLQHDFFLAISSTVLGSLASILGGYVAALFVSKYERLNATLASFLCVIFTLLSIGKTEWYWIVLGVIANPFLTFLGGQLRYMQRKRK